ncbi:MAG: type II toxin-antitoxin system VapC family toxin [Rickettsiales bacterium]|jgi:PIN domain nuclease of toxin-antitoxin system|nr:type II toxin-antitoxin system VapC family toxin [Rickettsiales bacterium]
MKFILDTHILLWWLVDDKKLSFQTKEIITDSKNIIYVSSVNIWEIEIKKSLGKLKAPEIDSKIIADCQFEELPVRIKHVIVLKSLPNHHNDPFDRLLICQSIVEKAKLLTDDNLITKYQLNEF